MAKEIERRFLVKEGFDPSTVSHDVLLIEQSYLGDTGSWTIRLRKVTFEGTQTSQHFVTMKKFLSAATNEEIEFRISAEDYVDMRMHTKSLLKKKRYRIISDDRAAIWEVDVYIDAPPEFKTICEVELPYEDCPITIPDWVEREVTGDRSFSNAALAERLTT